MKHLRIAALLGAAVLPLSATAYAAPGAEPAQAAPATPATPATPAPVVETGTVVYDSQGVEIGAVESVNGDSVVLAVGENRATLSKSAFGSSPKGVSLNTTKAQVEAAIAEAAAKAGKATSATPSPAG